jgi:hypothetical protein
MLPSDKLSPPTTNEELPLATPPLTTGPPTLLDATPPLDVGHEQQVEMMVDPPQIPEDSAANAPPHPDINLPAIQTEGHEGNHALNVMHIPMSDIPPQANDLEAPAHAIPASQCAADSSADHTTPMPDYQPPHGPIPEPPLPSVCLESQLDASTPREPAPSAAPPFPTGECGVGMAEQSEPLISSMEVSTSAQEQLAPAPQPSAAKTELSLPLVDQPSEANELVAPSTSLIQAQVQVQPGDLAPKPIGQTEEASIPAFANAGSAELIPDSVVPNVGSEEPGTAQGMGTIEYSAPQPVEQHPTSGIEPAVSEPLPTAGDIRDMGEAMPQAEPQPQGVEEQVRQTEPPPASSPSPSPSHPAGMEEPPPDSQSQVQPESSQVQAMVDALSYDVEIQMPNPAPTLGESAQLPDNPQIPSPTPTPTSTPSAAPAPAPAPAPISDTDHAQTICGQVVPAVEGTGTIENVVATSFSPAVPALVPESVISPIAAPPDPSVILQPSLAPPAAGPKPSGAEPGGSMLGFGAGSGILGEATGEHVFMCYKDYCKLYYANMIIINQARDECDMIVVEGASGREEGADEHPQQVRARQKA